MESVLRINTYENWGRVVCHKNGGLTVVEVTDADGSRLHMPQLELLTDCIPLALRPIGSRFLFQWDSIWPQESDTITELRARCRTAFRVLQSATT